jgi:hypothetical protein
MIRIKSPNSKPEKQKKPENPQQSKYPFPIGTCIKNLYKLTKVLGFKLLINSSYIL